MHMSIVSIMIIVLYIIENDWSDYGIDWDEVSTANDDTTVTLHDVPNIITKEEVTEFHSNNSINGCDLSRELLLRHFESAKSFVCTHAT